MAAREALSHASPSPLPAHAAAAGKLQHQAFTCRRQLFALAFEFAAPGIMWRFCNEPRARPQLTSASWITLKQISPPGPVRRPAARFFAMVRC